MHGASSGSEDGEQQAEVSPALQLAPPYSSSNSSEMHAWGPGSSSGSGDEEQQAEVSPALQLALPYSSSSSSSGMHA
jgi:hypothetical protein